MTFFYPNVWKLLLRMCAHVHIILGFLASSLFSKTNSQKNKVKKIRRSVSFVFLGQCFRQFSKWLCSHIWAGVVAHLKTWTATKQVSRMTLAPPSGQDAPYINYYKHGQRYIDILQRSVWWATNSSLFFSLSDLIAKNRLFKYLFCSTQECHWRASASWTRRSVFPASGLFCGWSGRERTWPTRGEQTDLTSAGFHSPLEGKKRRQRKELTRTRPKGSV